MKTFELFGTWVNECFYFCTPPLAPCPGYKRERETPKCNYRSGHLVLPLAPSDLNPGLFKWQASALTTSLYPYAAILLLTNIKRASLHTSLQSFKFEKSINANIDCNIYYVEWCELRVFCYTWLVRHIDKTTSCFHYSLVYLHTFQVGQVSATCYEDN